jgi:EAL domain-containing protein (putative c-di-GMP-specific phosphodiesterase class I)/GGDEF domain-containing protein
MAMASEVENEAVGSGTAHNTLFYPPSFMFKLDQTIRECKSQSTHGTLFFSMINNFAMILHGFGLDATEKLMQDIEMEVQSRLPENAHVQRIGRDLFGIITSSKTPADLAKDAILHAAEINDVIQNYSSRQDSGALHAICSLGSVTIPDSCVDELDAVNKVYIALNSTQGSNYRSFEDSLEDVDYCRQQVGLANYLRKAIENKRLKFAYQPVINRKTGETSHYEALLRLIGDDGKITTAGTLIPIAERMGLISLIDHLVLDMAVKELRESPNLSLAFNVSNLTTDNGEWMRHFLRLMEETPEIASRTVVEITETAAHRDLRKTAYFVASIQAAGGKVALDDFGSGYTSFRQLKGLSVDMVKIDGSFIRDIVDNPDNQLFVKTLMGFAQGLGAEAVAEFVENGETAKLLMEMGVEYFQGYYFGKPENHRSWPNEGEYKGE